MFMFQRCQDAEFKIINQTDIIASYPGRLSKKDNYELRKGSVCNVRIDVKPQDIIDLVDQMKAQ